MAWKIADIYAMFTVRGLEPFHFRLAALRTNIEGTSASMQALQRTAQIAFLGAAGAMLYSVKEAIRFEKEMAMVSTMLDESSMKFMPAYKRGILEMSQAYGEGTSTLAKGLYDILSASVEPSKALSLLDVSARAAVGGMTTTAVAVDALTTILNSFSISADGAAEVSDKMFVVVKRGKLVYEELAQNVGKVAASASIAGLSLDEMSAMLATATRVGLKADIATTSLMSAMNTFIKPTKEAQEAAKILGLDLSKVGLESEGIINFIEKMSGLPTSVLGKLVPNVRGFRAFAAAMKDTAGLQKDMDMLANSAGMAEEAFAKMAGTTSFEFGRLRKQITATFIAIGTDLLPQVMSLVRFLHKLTSAVQNNEGSVSGFLVTLAAFGLRLMAVITAIKLLSGALKLLATNPLGLLATALAALIVYFADWEAITESLTNKIGSLVDEAAGLQVVHQQETAALKQEDAALRADLRELIDLRSQTEMNNEQQERAVEIVNKLAEAYPTLADRIRDVGKSREADNKLLEESIRLSRESEIALKEQQLRKTKRITEEGPGLAEVDAAKQKWNAATVEWRKAMAKGSFPEVVSTGREMYDAKKEYESTLKAAKARADAREEMRNLQKELDDLAERPGRLVDEVIAQSLRIEQDRVAREADADLEAEREKDYKLLEMQAKTKWEMEEMDINMTQEGLDKKLALLDLEMRKEIDAAEATGAAKLLIAEKYAKKEAQIRRQFNLQQLQDSLGASEDAYTTVLRKAESLWGTSPEYEQWKMNRERSQIELALGPDAEQFTATLNAIFSNASNQMAGQWTGITDVFRDIQSAAFKPSLDQQKVDQLKELNRRADAIKAAIESNRAALAG